MASEDSGAGRLPRVPAQSALNVEWDVFLSYETEDRTLASLLRKKLGRSRVRGRPGAVAREESGPD